MRRTLVGWLVICHALAHASVSAWATTELRWSTSLIAAIAFSAYLASGLALLRLPVLRRQWRRLLVTATVASFLYLVWLLPKWGLLGVAIDLTIFLAALDVMDTTIEHDVDAAEAGRASIWKHPGWVHAGWAFGALFLIYGTVVMVLHPIIMGWGTTAEERQRSLPGDRMFASEPRYRIDHGITIHAPPDSIWPWLVQLGQDRGGFYSYDWLERSFGARIRNSDRIHSEWQVRQVGDTIRATQPAYLGGRLGTLGWRVTDVEPNRVLGLENWGTFVLLPDGANTTRLIVRTRGVGGPSAAALLLGPANVFVFEPAHFIMERRMLRGIRDRAERGNSGIVGYSPTKKQPTPHETGDSPRTERPGSEP